MTAALSPSMPTETPAQSGRRPVDRQALATRANSHYGARLRDASAGLVAFLRCVGLVGGASELLWKRARLV